MYNRRCQDRLSKAFYSLPRIDYWHKFNYREGYQLKTCTKCGGPPKPLTEFSKRARSRDGLQSWCKACDKAASVKYRAANPEKRRVYEAKRNAANPERNKASVAKWRAANPDKVRATAAKWHAENPESHRIRKHNRRARTVGKLSQGLAERLFKLQRGKCPCCKQPLGDDHHLDHIMPLALEGTNTDSNIQILCVKCNLQKHIKDPIEFMQQRGYLL